MLAHLLGDVEGQEFPRQSVSDSFRAKAHGAFLPAPARQGRPHPGQEPAVQHRPEGHADHQGPDRRPAQGVRQGLRREPRLLRQPGTRRPVRARPRQPRPVRARSRRRSSASRASPGRRAASRAPWKEPSIDRAFAEVNGRRRADGIIKQYSASYSVSIEDFADEVKAWLDKQDDPNFRLNFFVDEVGQFIGSNTKLMLNLQTIAESLNTKCAGRAWVFVTSQEDMEKVIGDRTRQQGNDFSKIQARFKTRVKLTSADVEEVIRKRLLEKNDAGAAALGTIYADRARQLQDAVRLRRRVEDLPQLHRRGPLHRDLPVRQLPVPAVPGRDRGHLRPQRLRGPQQLGRRAVHARRRPAGRQGHRQRRGRPRSRPSTTCSPASGPR